MALPEIDILGTGNLAYNLAPALEQSGFIINRVYGRSLKAAKNLASNLYQAAPTDSLDFSDSRSSVLLLAISDDALEEVSRELVLPDNALVAHTSGTRPLAVLGYTASPNIGVFYPLQTFSKQKRVKFSGVPILIEGDNTYAEKTLIKIAGKVSNKVQKANSRQRKLIHLAAVFAANFTNAMLVHAEELIQQANADLALLAPLLEETLGKSMLLGPAAAQTGPAARGDLQVLDEHMQMLAATPARQEVYRLISQQILDRRDEE